jgi:hypothetical protein
MKNLLNAFSSKAILTLITIIILHTGGLCQPTDAEIRKEITNDGTKSIKFTSTGTRQWNKDIGNWEWVRGVEVTRKSDYAGIDLLVVGDVVYQYTGVGKYNYWKFRTISNQYFGIPNPTSNEVIEIVSKDWQKFYGYYFQKITKEHFKPALADDPQWIWHSPNSVEFKMKLKFDHIINNTDIETVETIWNVRLYRDEPKTAWKKFIANRSQEASETKKVGVQKYTATQINDMEKQTLAFTLNEQTAKEQISALPSINVPEFSNGEELVKFIHNILRNGDEQQFRSAMMKLMAPGFYVEGSAVQLRGDIERALQDVITAAYKDKSTYKQMYCQKPPYRVENWADGRKSVYIPAAVNNCTSLFITGLVNMGYKEGVMQTKLRILEFNVYVRHDADAIAYVSSFSDRKKMCGND